jgi:hypothetical protein
MTIEIKPNDYVLGIWIFDSPPYNLLGLVLKDESGWQFHVRSRTYIDDKVFDSADHKRFWEVRFKGDQTEAQVLEDVRGIFKSMQRAFGGGDYHETLVRSTDPHALHQALKKTPYIHIMPIG